MSDPDGSPIGGPRALRREFLVWCRGLGLGVPIISLVTLIVAFKRLKRRGTTSRDEELSLRPGCRPASAAQRVLYFVGVLLSIAAWGLLATLAHG